MSEGPPAPRGALVQWRLVQRPFLVAFVGLAGGVAVYFATRGLLLDIAQVFSDSVRARHVTNVFVALGAVAAAALFVGRFGLAALVIVPFIVGPLWPADPQPSTGDEPHYLVIAESVVRDHDLSVADEYARPGAPPSEGHLSWDIAHDRPSNYSLHQPGTGILVAPGWAVAGRRGAQFVIALIAGLLVREMVLIGERLGADRRTAVVVAALVYLSPAVFLHARTALSEAVVALLLLHLFRRGIQVTRGGALRNLDLASAALAAAAVPWFHLRFAAFAALLAAAIVPFGRAARSATPLLAFGLSSALLLLSFHAWYGSWSPAARYQHAAGAFEWPSLRSVLGLLVDGHAGILFAAPLTALACVAATVTWRRAPQLVAIAGVGIVVSFVIGASWSEWWLGTATPGRFWAPLVPFTAPLLAVAWPRLPNAVRWVAGLGTVAIATAFLTFPWAAYPNGANGSTRLWSSLGLSRVIPTLIDHVGVTPMPVAGLLAGSVGAAIVLGNVWLSRQARDLASTSS